MAGIEQLISHRFRGFAKYENTLAGLKAALDFGVRVAEFDVRVTACGTPIIYHDEYAKDSSGKKHHISKTYARDFSKLGGTFSHMPTADELFDLAASHPNQSAKLLIDIKDYGFEEEINALIHMHRLQARSVYVSWLPNVLYKMHEIAPRQPLCLSHWPKNPGPLIRAVHKVYSAPTGTVPRLSTSYIHGERSGWYIMGGVKGKLRAILKRVGGSVCVPHNMLQRGEIDAYHKDGIKVSAFSYTDWKTINEVEKKFKVDLYFIDNKRIFDTIL